MKKMLLSAGVLAVLSTWADPVVGNVAIEQMANGRVEITYTLSGGPAVITLDIETNAVPNSASGWTSIGGENVQCFAEDSEVWRKVESGDRRIVWHPELAWTGKLLANGCCRAVVSAWSLDDTPDYMVVDISQGASPNTQRYYPSAAFLPGGDHNPEYRLNSLLLKKMMAKDVTWKMGCDSGEVGRRSGGWESIHNVTLSNNYYIGVYEITQNQWTILDGWTASPQGFCDPTCGAMRPVERVSYIDIRCDEYKNEHSRSGYSSLDYSWPNAPHPHSYLGLLRTRTGLDFDLPSEAEWEFAAKAGHGTGCWGDGSAIEDSVEDQNLKRLGRYTKNGGGWSSVPNSGNNTRPKYVCDTNTGTAICGSYAPNDWGLYDMHGNVAEICLDYADEYIASLNGQINVDPTDNTKSRNGTADAYGYHILKTDGIGGHSGGNRASYRNKTSATNRNVYIGLRVVCRAGLK